ncbi:MAG: phosphatase PAP2 family protein [Nitrospirae bacterium]|nr:phosphatase PAP2 family protein [Nitrospirota bacterium]
MEREKSMRPVDILTFGFVTFLFIITLFFIRQIPHANLILFIYAFLISTLSVLIYLTVRYDGKFLRFLYDIVYPVISVLLVFDSLGGLIRYINPKTYDHILIRLDYMIFNAYPTVALENITTPVITEFFQLAYISYYFLPIIFGITLRLKNNRSDFNRSLFLIILCFFLSYIGYILVPAIGPRYTMNHLQSTELPGILLRDSINNILNALEGVKRDAFPSGHTAITLVVLYLSYRFQRRLFWIFLPIVIALLISTVYLRYHYVVDVIGGILLSVFTIYFGNKVYGYWDKANGYNKNSH